MLSLLLLEGALGAKLIDLGLSVGGLLLGLAQTLNLLFLLFGDAFRFACGFRLSDQLFAVVLVDLFLYAEFFLSALSLNLNGLFVAHLHLGDHLLDASLAIFLHLLVLFVHLSNLLENFGALLGQYFLLTDTRLFVLLHLLDDR